MSAPRIAYVGLGANLGDAAATLGAALEALGRLPGTRLLRASQLYRSAAWGPVEQPDFINSVAMVETTQEPGALLESLLGMERDFGRDRSAAVVRWGPRVLDLDLLLYDDLVLQAPGLTLPHPHLHERAFVLLPLLEIAPDVHIPGIGPARDAASGLGEAGVVALLP